MEEYRRALFYLRLGDYWNASFYAGAMIHYIADPAAFPHVMGRGTAWGAMIHGAYERWADRLLTTPDAEAHRLRFDGRLDVLSAYDASLAVGNATSVRLKGLSDGRHVLAVRAVDRAGNTVVARVTFRVSLDPMGQFTRLLHHHTPLLVIGTASVGLTFLAPRRRRWSGWFSGLKGKRQGRKP
jgi:hypothetical protein